MIKQMNDGGILQKRILEYTHQIVIDLCLWDYKFFNSSRRRGYTLGLKIHHNWIVKVMTDFWPKQVIVLTMEFTSNV